MTLWRSSKNVCAATKGACEIITRTTNLPFRPRRASSYVLAPLEEEAEDDGAACRQMAKRRRLVIAEATKSVRTMTVSMAVMQLDLSESPALMFRNAANGELNVVYRRPDGNVGWIDPGAGTAKRRLSYRWLLQ
jgi:hypothetical protein